jgi:transcription antitermination protein NusB
MNKVHQGRSVARLAAVQALYQMEVSGAGVEAVIREFLDHRFDADLEGEQLAGADVELFGQIVRGVIEDQHRIDAAVARRLAQNWRLERIDATLRAMFRAGA